VLLTSDFTERVGLLTRRSLATLQINVGKLCNQACVHCHVEAGPKRTEVMNLRTAQRLMELMTSDREHLGCVDITGGAPELNPHFRGLVTHARSLGLRVIDRCNLTVLLLEGQEDTVDFLADHGVEVSASLPCYSQENVESQRGKGVFGRSVEGLRRLNRRGYGVEGTGLVLNLVYNPGGAFLPPSQQALQEDYKRRLYADLGVSFNQLHTLTNMPIRRFRRNLVRRGQLDTYMQLLNDNFNESTVAEVMCRDQVSVSWDGQLFDCDFNQMLEIPVPGSKKSVWDVQSLVQLNQQPIAVDNHCFGCTAGTGSSCGGSLTNGSAEEVPS